MSDVLKTCSCISELFQRLCEHYDSICETPLESNLNDIRELENQISLQPALTQMDGAYQLALAASTLEQMIEGLVPCTTGDLEKVRRHVLSAFNLLRAEGEREREERLPLLDYFVHPPRDTY